MNTLTKTSLLLRWHHCLHACSCSTVGPCRCKEVDVGKGAESSHLETNQTKAHGEVQLLRAVAKASSTGSKSNALHSLNIWICSAEKVNTCKSDKIRKHFQPFLCLSSATYALPWRFVPLSPISRISGESNCISVGLAARVEGWRGVCLGAGGLLGCGQTPGCTYSSQGGDVEGSLDRCAPLHSPPPSHRLTRESCMWMSVSSD